MIRRLKQSASLLIVAVTLVSSSVQAAAPPNSVINAVKGDRSWVKNDNVGCRANSVTLAGKDNEEKIYNFLVGKGLKSFQAAGVMGNMVAESGLNPQQLQGKPIGTVTTAESYILKYGRSSGPGWGLVQFTPGQKFILKTDSISDANDLGTQLNFIWDQLEGKTDIPEKQAGDDIKGTPNLEEAVLAFQGNKQVGGKYIGYERPQDEAASVPERTAAAKIIYDKYGDGSASSVINAAGCAGQPGTIEAAIATAIKYAWPTINQQPLLQMKPEYEAAIVAARANGEYIGGNSTPGIDCGGFITRVMRDSGADPEYNKFEGPTSAQERYMATSSKYQKVADLTKLRPGDIAVNSVHTYMYMGTASKDAGFEGNAVSASLSEKAPMASTTYFSSGNGEAFTWYRLTSNEVI